MSRPAVSPTLDPSGHACQPGRYAILHQQQCHQSPAFLDSLARWLGLGQPLPNTPVQGFSKPVPAHFPLSEKGKHLLFRANILVKKLKKDEDIFERISEEAVEDVRGVGDSNDM